MKRRRPPVERRKPPDKAPEPPNSDNNSVSSVLSRLRPKIRLERRLNQAAPKAPKQLTLFERFVRNLRENQLFYDNKKQTQVVFLGRLDLKPKPSAFNIKLFDYNNLYFKYKNDYQEDCKPDLKAIKMETIAKAQKTMESNNKDKKPLLKTTNRVSKRNPIKVKEAVIKREPGKRNAFKIKLNKPKKQQTYKIINSPKKLLSVVKDSNLVKNPASRKKPGRKPKQERAESSSPNSKKENKTPEKVFKQEQPQNKRNSFGALKEMSDNNKGKQKVLVKQQDLLVDRKPPVWRKTVPSPILIPKQEPKEEIEDCDEQQQEQIWPQFDESKQFVRIKSPSTLLNDSVHKKSKKRQFKTEPSAPTRRSLRQSVLTQNKSNDAQNDAEVVEITASKAESIEILDITQDDDDDDYTAPQMYQDPASIVEQIAKITGCTNTSMGIIDLDLILDKPEPVKLKKQRQLRSNAAITFETIELEPPTRKRRSAAKVARVKPMMKDLYEFDDSEEVQDVRDVKGVSKNLKMAPPPDGGRGPPELTPTIEKQNTSMSSQAEIDAIFARPDKLDNNLDIECTNPKIQYQTNELNCTDNDDNGNFDYDDDDDLDDEPHGEWMPDDYAEYKMQYSAKKSDAYKPVHKCKVCLNIFTSYHYLNKHKVIHVQAAEPYQCNSCLKSFKEVEEFNAHLRIHKGKEPFNCKKCRKAFQTEEELEKHESTHVLRRSRQPTQAEIQKRQEEDQTDPTSESPKQNKRKRFRCQECGKEFPKPSEMERHHRVHTGEKPNQCNICHKKFQQSYNLSKHLITHLHVRPFECDICNKQFGRYDVLNRHLLTHSIDKPFKCPICSKGFIRSQQLKRHQASSHKDAQTESAQLEQQADDVKAM